MNVQFQQRADRNVSRVVCTEAKHQAPLVSVLVIFLPPLLPCEEPKSRRSLLESGIWTCLYAVFLKGIMASFQNWTVYYVVKIEMKK